MEAEHEPDTRLEEELTEEELEAEQLSELIEAFETGKPGEVLENLDAYHPADAADLLEQLPRSVLSETAELLGEQFPTEILLELRDEYREIVVDNLPDAAISEAVNSLDSDDAALILEDLAEDRQSAILENMEIRDREELERVLAFDEESAGRLMQRDFLAAPEFWTVGQAVDHARANAEDLPDVFFEIYIIDPAFRVVGAVPLHKIMRTPRSVPLGQIAEEIEVEIGPDMDQEEVAYLFQKYDLTSAPVVDESGRLTGMVTIDDVVDVIQEENREDLLALSGVSSAGGFDTVVSSFRSRAPWLLINVFTAFIASGVISMFSATIDSYVALAVLMPVVVALGGNAGSQTLAVSVRGIAERELSGSAARRAIVRELLTAIINGIVFSAAVAVIAFFWFADVRLSLVIAIAMIGTFLWAGLSGILIPLGLQRLGADPAVSSSVFLLTTVDIVGFLSFLGLATLLLL
ncbi:magnesium transporter [Ponticaulis profundi]|uniref:Magnesium transporter MgtE n=1 Tax=Ponticaulis profundi TaxID=2665222 RepID=A0ABW1S4G8_9PROT